MMDFFTCNSRVSKAKLNKFCGGKDFVAIKFSNGTVATFTWDRLHLVSFLCEEIFDCAFSVPAKPDFIESKNGFMKGDKLQSKLKCIGDTFPTYNDITCMEDGTLSYTVQAFNGQRSQPQYLRMEELGDFSLICQRYEIERDTIPEMKYEIGLISHGVEMYYATKAIAAKDRVMHPKNQKARRNALIGSLEKIFRNFVKKEAHLSPKHNREALYFVEDALKNLSHVEVEFNLDQSIGYEYVEKTFLLPNELRADGGRGTRNETDYEQRKEVLRNVERRYRSIDPELYPRIDGKTYTKLDRTIIPSMLEDHLELLRILNKSFEPSIYEAIREQVTDIDEPQPTKREETPEIEIDDLYVPDTIRASADNKTVEKRESAPVADPEKAAEILRALKRENIVFDTIRMPDGVVQNFTEPLPHESLIDTYLKTLDKRKPKKSFLYIPGTSQINVTEAVVHNYSDPNNLTESDKEELNRPMEALKPQPPPQLPPPTVVELTYCEKIQKRKCEFPQMEFKSPRFWMLQ